MPKNSKSNERRISPPEEVIGILQNSLDLAMSQKLTEARDVIKAAQIVADDFGLDDGDTFKRLSESVMSKPYSVLPAYFNEAFMEIKSAWSKIEKK